MKITNHTDSDAESTNIHTSSTNRATLCISDQMSKSYLKYVKTFSLIIEVLGAKLKIISFSYILVMNNDLKYVLSWPRFDT